jgi:rubrerythrin
VLSISPFNYLIDSERGREISHPERLTHRLKRMYRCQICQQSVPVGTKARRVVTETRPRVYPFRAEANRGIKRNTKIIYPDDTGGTGWEIAREITACPACSEQRERQMNG